jgi:hypothetical protein
MRNIRGFASLGPRGDDSELPQPREGSNGAACHEKSMDTARKRKVKCTFSSTPCALRTSDALSLPDPAIAHVWKHLHYVISATREINLPWHRDGFSQLLHTLVSLVRDLTYSRCCAHPRGMNIDDVVPSLPKTSSCQPHDYFPSSQQHHLISTTNTP